MTAQQRLITLARRLALAAASLPGPDSERTLRDIAALTAQVRAAAEDLQIKWPLSPELAAAKERWRGVDRQKCL
jgi:hypothetical protein